MEIIKPITEWATRLFLRKRKKIRYRVIRWMIAVIGE